jgi:aldose 1-epimerase
MAVAKSSYFNIGNRSTIDGTTVQLFTAMKQDVDEGKIPTGTTSSHSDIRLFTESTPLSFTLGEKEPVFDHCFVFSEMPEPTIDTRTLPLRDIAHLFSETSRVNLLASTTEPTFQLYTGDGVDVKDEGKVLYGSRSGLCIEAGRPINSVNDPKHRKWVSLKEGEIYGSYTTYTVWLSR